MNENIFKKIRILLIRVVELVLVKGCLRLTQSGKRGSMASASNSRFQVLSAHRVISLCLVKGKPLLAQIHIIGKASRFDSFACGSRTTSIGLCVKFQTSRMYLMATGSMNEGCSTECQGIKFRRFWKSVSIEVEESTMGSQRTSYSCLVGCWL